MEALLQPKISVLIPCYNREETISRCIESAATQDYENLEIIVSDNASTDATWELVSRLAEAHKRVKIFRNSENLGPFSNWRCCLKVATGDFVHWLWSDDWIEAGFYSEAARRLRSDKSQVVTTWNYRNDPGRERYISWRYSFDTESGIVAARKVFAMTMELPVSPAAYLIPRESAGVLMADWWDDPGIAECAGKGIGVDSAMVIAALRDARLVSVLSAPYVNFTKSASNISTVESKSGNLGRCYRWVHSYFLLKEGISLTHAEVPALVSGLRGLTAVGKVKYASALLADAPRLALAVVWWAGLTRLAGLCRAGAALGCRLLVPGQVARKSETARFKSPTED